MPRAPVLQVVWFKRDLRTADHRPLVAAAHAGPVLPLYVAEPALWAQPDASLRQWQFVAESLHDLRRDLAARGQPLVVRVGEVTSLLGRLRARFGSLALWSHEETGTLWTWRRDRAVGAWCGAHGVVWTEFAQNGVVRRLASRDGWARRWDATMAGPLTEAPASLPRLSGVEPGEIPDGATLGLAEDPCAGRPHGGRCVGLALLDSFLDHRGARYHRNLSSPITAATGCSRLSAHIAWGTLSLREVTQAAQRRLAQAERLPAGHRGADWARAMQAFVARLHWHCHFIQKLESEPRLEYANAHPAYDGMRPDPEDTAEAAARFAAWCDGCTGLPFVDACMRALTATGWINFRMRAMLCAVASYHLWLHWRVPSLHLARRFVDYEPGIHYAQMQMQSGTTGINTVRIYNPVKQGLDHDPDGRFIRHWCPELAAIPDARIHRPWTLDAASAAAFGAAAYPSPIVDPMGSARAARARVWAVRHGPDFTACADAIQERHGSRKSGMTVFARKPKPTAKASRQLALSLEDAPNDRSRVP